MTELRPEMIADYLVPRELDLSYDGMLVTYAMVPNSKKEGHPTSSLWVASVDGSRPARQFTRGDAEDRKPKWSTDRGQIAFLSDRDKRGTAQLYLIASDGGEARSLTSITNQKPIEDFAWSPKGGYIAFTSADEPSKEDELHEKERDDGVVYGEKWAYARLRLLSLATGEITSLEKEDLHVSCFTWSPDGSELAYVLQQTPEHESWASETVIKRIAIEGSEPYTVCRFPSALISLVWSPDGKTLLFLAPVDPELQAPLAVYTVPMQGGEPHRLAPSTLDEWCVDSLRWPNLAQRPTILVLEGLETRLCWLDTSTSELTALSPTRLDDRLVSISDWMVHVTPRGDTILAVVKGNCNQPWEIWTGKVTGQAEVLTLYQVSIHHAELHGLTFSPQEFFTWHSHDGWNLDGILMLPPNASRDQPLPTIVLIHGGPYRRWSHEIYFYSHRWGQWLAQAGYAVLMPNTRGGSGHGERFATAVRGDAGGDDYIDVMSALDNAIERGIADPSRLGIGGWSQGGFMSAWAVTQSNRFKAAIMGAGISDWGMMVMTSRMPYFQRALSGGAPWEGVGPHHHAQHSPISFSHAVKTPILIIHGQEDTQVPVSQAIGFHRALREQGVPTELVVYPREPHVFIERAHQIDVLKRVRRWFDRWLRT